jgi:hypothetical protein
MTLVPAYGRDYKTLKEVLQDWNSGKDFVIQDFFSRWDGKPVNRQDVEREGAETSVMVRYRNQTQIAMIKLAR